MNDLKKLPKEYQARYREITEITDKFCSGYLNEEYQEKCRELTAFLLQLDDFNINRGLPKSWAGGIIHSIGFASFLTDPQTTPCMPTKDLFELIDISSTTGNNKSRQIRDRLNIDRLNPNWSVKSEGGNNNLDFMLQMFQEKINLAENEDSNKSISRNEIQKLQKENSKKNPFRNIGFDSDTLYEFRIKLLDTKIWRKVLIPSYLTMNEFHIAIQIAMGWEDSHLYSFLGKFGQITQDDEYNLEMGVNYISSFETKVGQVFQGDVKSIKYVYDFGDDWMHEITLNRVLQNDKLEKYPKCIGGKKACPVEDIGGIYGYFELLDTLKDKSSDEYKEFLQWHGDDYDSELFNIDEVNKLLNEVFAPYNKGNI